MNQRILVISPHCDDETYGLGGTILKYIKKNYEVNILTICAGDISFEHNGQTITRRDRINEFSSVLNAYGIYGKVLDFSQESLLDTVPTKEIINKIEKYQDVYQADIWYIPGMSYHQDHRKVFEACAAAARPTREFTPKEIYSYEHPLYSWNPPIWRFTPQVYEDISEELDRKIEICNLYKSQLREGVLGIKHIRDYSIACGTECGLRAAERFEVIRMVR